MRFLSRFVDSNDREVRRILPLVEEANALEAEFEALTPEQIRAQIDEIREEIHAQAQPDEPSEDELHHQDLERRRELRKERRKRENERLQKALDDVCPRRSPCREARSGRSGMRHYDVQLIGGAVLHEGKIAEMRTGEGKTLVATCRVPQRADRPGRPRRDRQRLPRPARRAVDGPGLPRARPERRRDPARRGVHLRPGLRHERRAPDRPAAGAAGARRTPPTSPTARTTSSASTTCATTWSIGSSELVQRELHYAIVDEVDNILIDEARTPLIISGQAEEATDVLPVRPHRAAPQDARGSDFDDRPQARRSDRP